MYLRIKWFRTFNPNTVLTITPPLIAAHLCALSPIPLEKGGGCEPGLFFLSSMTPQGGVGAWGWGRIPRYPKSGPGPNKNRKYDKCL